MFKWLQWPGQVTKQPMKVRFDGIPAGSSEAYQLGQALRPQINHFLMAQVQQQRLSERDVYKKRATYPDLEMVYSYIHGQETLDIRVATSLIYEVLQRGGELWDFALIEMFMPDVHYVDGAAAFNCWAHLVLPIEQKLTFTDVWPVDGLATNELVRPPPPDKMINCANSGSIIRTEVGGTSEAYASFTVDLRPAHGLSAVVVDLHSYVWTKAEQFPGAVIFINPLPLYTSDPPEPMTEYEALHSYTTDEFLPGHPELIPAVFLDVDLEWKFSITGLKTYEQFLGFYSIGTGPPTYNWWLWYVYTQTGYSPPYIGPDPIPAEVQLTLFRGVPPLDVTQYTVTGPLTDYSVTDGVDYNRWTFPLTFPKRPEHMKLSDVGVPTFNPNKSFPNPSSFLMDIYGVPKTGSVVIGLKTTDGASWQGA